MSKMLERLKSWLGESGMGVRMDAGFGAFIDQELEALESELYRVEYQDLKARQWLPLKSDVPAGAETFAYKVLDMFGMADFIAPWSSALPNVGIRVEKKVGRVEGIGNSFSYSKQDLRAAAMAGMSLDPELAQVALRAHEERVNNTALLGNEPMGFIGFFKHPDVAVLAVTADWDSTTGENILKDLRRMQTKVLEQSNGKFQVTQIILPLTSYNVANTLPVNTSGSVQDTVLTVFLRGAPGVSVGWDVNLETAGVGSTKRAVAYQKDPKVAQLVVPMEPEIGEPQLQDLHYKRTVESRTGGAIVRQSIAMVYLDGL